MNQPKFVFKLFFLLVALSFSNSFAQTDKQLNAEPSYEVVLQILSASNRPGEKPSLPSNLGETVKKLKNLYSFAEYRLETTFLQRTSQTIEYKGLMPSFSMNQTSESPAFSEWSLRGLRKLPDGAGRNSLQIESFRFGARIPISFQAQKDESGKTGPPSYYESIGLTSAKFTLTLNDPTVIGSLTTAKRDEMLFLILTVKEVD